MWAYRKRVDEFVNSIVREIVEDGNFGSIVKYEDREKIRAKLNRMDRYASNIESQVRSSIYTFLNEELSRPENRERSEQRNIIFDQQLRDNLKRKYLETLLSV